MAVTLHERIMQAVRASLLADMIDPFWSERIFIRKTSDQLNLILPCVLIHLEGVKEVLRPIETEWDERILPVQVTVLDRQDQRQDDLLGLVLWWRQKMSETFLMQLLERVPEVWHVEVKPFETHEAGTAIGPEYQKMRNSFLLECHVITPRRRA